MCLPKMEEDNLMLFVVLVISFFSLSIFFIVTLVLIKRLQKLENCARVLKASLAANSVAVSTTTTNTNTNHNAHTDPTHFAQTLLLDISPSKSAKWKKLLITARTLQDRIPNGSGLDEDASVEPSVLEEEKNGAVEGKEVDESGAGVISGSGQEVVVGDEEKRVKKKKKKGKKKLEELKGGEEVVILGEENGGERENSEPGLGLPELGCPCPVTSMGSATQRRIKELYHQLEQSCEKNELTLAQVGEFTKCLAQAKEELEEKSEAIKRKFSIKKALLSKADRSSIGRFRQQIYNLEKQQKRLEEDVSVYNWLQDQLQLSPACKKMLELCEDMEQKTKSTKPLESTETDEVVDMSFEELLAQEKKDSFWQKDWKSRMCTR